MGRSSTHEMPPAQRFKLGASEGALSETNKTSIKIDNKDHFSAAMIFGFTPKQPLEKVAINNNISIPMVDAMNANIWFSKGCYES